MFRTALSLFALSVILLSPSAPTTGADNCVGYLGELVPWPTMSAGMRVVRLELATEPYEEITGQGMWGPVEEAGFGILPLGTGEDPGISIMFLPGDPPRLIIDTDNDEDFSDESGDYPIEQIDPRSFSWYATVLVDYGGEDMTSHALYHVCITALYDRATATYEYGYSGFCQRRGLIALDGKLYPISITSLLSNAVYSDRSELVVVIDTDGDGVLDDLPGSHEVYGPGEPIQVGQALYRIVSVSDDGRMIVVERAGTAPPRPIIARGEPAPDFQTTTVTGAPITLSELQGRVVVLFFLPLSGGCTDSGSPTVPPAVSRLSATWKVIEPFGESVQMIVVSESIPEELPLKEEGISYISDPDVVRLYRRSYGVFVIDQQGTIRAMDEPWSRLVEGRPKGEFDLLHPSEILGIVERLLEGEGGD